MRDSQYHAWIGGGKAELLGGDGWDDGSSFSLFHMVARKEVAFDPLRWLRTGPSTAFRTTAA